MSKIQDALHKMRTTTTRNVSLGAVVDLSATTKLATISEDDIPADGAARRGSSKTIKVDRSLLRQEGFLAPEDQERQFADQYRLIKRPLLNNATEEKRGADNHAGLIMIASALPGDGKTFVCVNLALSVSVERDTSVLLVDADVAKPHASHLFAVDEEPGLIDVLTNPDLSYEDVIVHTDVPGLSVMPAGGKSDCSTELLASKRMAKLLEALATSDPNRIVVFDSPPLLSASEAGVLASRMGQIALVVRANHTPQQAVLDAVDTLDQDKPVNVILNQASKSGAAGAYGRYGYPAYA